MVSVSVGYLFYQPMDEEIITWPLRFPAKEYPNMVACVAGAKRGGGGGTIFFSVQFLLTTFVHDQHTSHLLTVHTCTVFTYDIHNVSYECSESNLHDTICHEVRTHASRARINHTV